MGQTDRGSGRYDALADTSDNLSCGRPLEAVQVRPGDVCVDLGCGRGAEAIRLARAVGPSGRVWGVDSSERMVEVARAAASQAGLTNVTFLCTELARIELPSAQADWIVSNCALNHASDKWALWREIHRLLKPGGTFVVSDIYALEPVPEHYRNDPEAVAECWAGAVTRGEYFAQIEQAGLASVEVVRESQPYRRVAATLASFTITGRRP